MAFFNFPFHIAKDKPAVANEVQANFDALYAWIADNLVQTDGSLPTTGPIVLPPGPPGAPDHAANKAYVDAVVPIGTIWEFGGAVLPPKWLWCNGATYTNTSQPQLAAALGRVHTAAGIPADSFQVPDRRKRMGIGADPGEAAVFALGLKGGQRNSELLSHQHANPVHEHVIQEHGHSASGWTGGGGGVDHLHTPGTLAGSAGTSTNGQHGHNLGHGSEIFYNGVSGYGGYGSGGLRITNFYHEGNHSHTFDVGMSRGTTGAADRALDHNHPIGVSVANQAAFWTNTNTGATTSNLVGAGTTLVDKNLPPYIVLNYIIYAGA